MPEKTSCNAQEPEESMEEYREVYIEGPQHRQEHVSGRSVLCASVAGMAIGGPLLGMTGCSFIASVALLLISSPLLLLFSPLLFCAALLLVGAVAGFSAAAANAVAGASALRWVFRELRGRGDHVGTSAESGDRMKKLGEGWAAHLQHNEPDNTWNRSSLK